MMPVVVVASAQPLQSTYEVSVELLAGGQHLACSEMVVVHAWLISALAMLARSQIAIWYGKCIVGSRMMLLGQ